MKLLISSLLLVLVIGFSNTVSAQCGNELIEQCVSENGGAKYLKHFRARLDAAKNEKNIPSVEFPIMLIYLPSLSIKIESPYRPWILAISGTRI